MLQKLKSKIIGNQVFRKISYSIYGGIVFTALLGFFSVNFALADATCSQTPSASVTQTCDLTQITVQTNILVNAKAGNFITAGQQDGSFTFEVQVTLVSPPSLTFGSTKIGSATSTSILLGTSENAVRGFERRGLLTATRTSTGVRLFELADVERLARERATRRAEAQPSPSHDDEAA